ncbi:MAG: hypothetical protein ACR2GT_01310 [Gaiellaceae bacterium]
MAVALVLVGLAGGCGGNEQSAGSTAAEPAEALALAAARLREEGTFRFEASFTRVKETAPDDVEEYATAEGAVDLGAGRSRASFELAPLFPGRENEAPLDKPVELRWNGQSVTAVSEGRSQRIARARARESGGLFGRYPDEVDALDDLLADAVRPRLLGSEGGVARYGFEIDSRRAGRRGFPAELYKLFAQGRDRPKLELEAWIGDDGLPSRLDYIIGLEPVRNAGKLVLPARTIRVTYELSAFGETVELDG